MTPVGSTGGLLNAISDNVGGLMIGENGSLIIPETNTVKLK